jgi:hypothetical protein
MIACCLLPLAGRSSPPALSLPTHLPTLPMAAASHLCRRPARGPRPPAAGQRQDRARQPATGKDQTARTVEDLRWPRPPAPAAVPRSSRAPPTPARPLCSELPGARTRSRVLRRSSPRLDPAPGRSSSPHPALAGARHDCPCTELPAPASFQSSPTSRMPLAGACRARLWPEHAADARSRRGEWRSNGEAHGRGEGGEQEAVVGEAAEELGGKVRPARGRGRHAS